MTAPRLRAAGDTHAGLQRDNNEDRYFFDDRRGVFCVIDGVGGQIAGERAAEIAADTLRSRLTSANGAAPNAAARALAAPSLVTLREALTAANQAIFDAASRDRTLNGMACVATIAVADGERLRFGHVGDTRLFKIRDGAIAKLTHDHSPVGELEDSGALTEVEAMRHPRRNEIYRDLGSQPRQRDEPAFIEVGEANFERDAALVLCSDGLSDLVSSGSVRRIVEAHAGAPALAVQELITAANDAGGKDNVTVLVVEGDRFAEAVAARGSRKGRTRPATTAAATGASAAPAPVADTRGRGGVMRAVGLVLAGFVLGAAAVAGAQYAGWDVSSVLERLGVAATSSPRTWKVGLDAEADFPTIGEALAKAGPGDTIEVGAGEYRESLTLTTPVTLLGSPQSLLKPPLGAPADWTAITVRQAQGARVSGFRIAAAGDEKLGTGVAVEGANVELENLEVAGAGLAGIDFRDGSRGVLRRSFVHHNGGAGVVLRAGSEPQVEFNVILHNGSAPASDGPGVLIEAGARPTLTGNGIGHNRGGAVAGPAAAELAVLARDNVLSPAPAAVVTAPPAAPARRGPARNRTR